ncbi:MAG TPA: hypothetical protein DCG37_09325, partial [Lachnospiraceae bacterium]|nr:hypothetical protein [Lachnospiraceae bacterium]
IFGENYLLKPLCGFIAFSGSLIGRILCDSTDFLIVMLRKTVIREIPVRGRKSMKPGRLEAFLRNTSEATATIFAGFTFALGMTCVGVVLILGVLVILLMF